MSKYPNDRETKKREEKKKKTYVPSKSRTIDNT